MPTNIINNNTKKNFFSTTEKSDRLGNQARTILKNHLQQTNRFSLYDRDNLDALQQESRLLGEEMQLKGARYVLTGAVTDFGRKTVGDKQLWPTKTG